MNLTQTLMVLLIVILVLATAGATLRTAHAEPGNAEADDDKLVELTSFASLRDAFNSNQGKVRIVTLLSPSCGYCVKGYRYMRKIFDEVDDDDLRMYVVWLPMLSEDSKAVAERISGEAADTRIVCQSWDEDRLTGKAWRDLMDMDGIAWDVYYLYDRDASWDDSEPTPPDYWEHQLSELGSDRFLSYDTFKSHVVDMLRGGS